MPLVPEQPLGRHFDLWNFSSTDPESFHQPTASQWIQSVCALHQIWFSVSHWLDLTWLTNFLTPRACVSGIQPEVTKIAASQRKIYKNHFNFSISLFDFYKTRNISFTKSSIYMHIKYNIFNQNNTASTYLNKLSLMHSITSLLQPHFVNIFPESCYLESIE